MSTAWRLGHSLLNAEWFPFLFYVIFVVGDAVDTFMLSCLGCTFFHFTFAGTVRTCVFSFAFGVFMVISTITCRD